MMKYKGYQAFVQFDDPVYGIRAIARIMKSYEREGINTLAKAIDRWAPPNENNSQAYIDDVCAHTPVAGPWRIHVVYPQQAADQHGSGKYRDRRDEAEKIA